MLSQHIQCKIIKPNSASSNRATFKTRGEKTMSESAGQIFRIRNNVKSHINRMEGNCCLARSKNTWTKRAGFFCEAKSMTNDLQLSAANVRHLDHERVLCEFLLAHRLQNWSRTRTRLRQQRGFFLALLSTTWPCSVNETRVCPDLNS